MMKLRVLKTIYIWPEYAIRQYYIKNSPKSINGSLKSSSIRCNEESKQVTRNLVIASFFRKLNGGEKIKEIGWLILKPTTYCTVTFVNYFPSKQRWWQKGRMIGKIYIKNCQSQLSTDHINSILIFVTRSKLLDALTLTC